MKKERKTTKEYEQNRKRKIQKVVRLAPEELSKIEKGMKATGLNFTDYIITMTVQNGIIVKQDFDSVRELSNALNKIGTNINQIAHKVNADNYADSQDMKYLKKQIEDMWKELDKVLRRNSSTRR